MNAKQIAAEAALELISSNMVIGLGTGSTADFFLVALGESLRSGRLSNITGVPTSRRSEQRAIELGIPLTSLANCGQTDITVDGADEVAPNLDVIKGLGGALLREKIVAQHSRRLAIIADDSKVVTMLGTRSPLPVEVAVFEHQSQAAFLRSLGSTPTLRLNQDGTPFLSDNSNFIYDCRFEKIADPPALERTLRTRAGIIDSGMFLGMASIAFIGSAQGVRKMENRTRT